MTVQAVGHVIRTVSEIAKNVTTHKADFPGYGIQTDKTGGHGLMQKFIVQNCYGSVTVLLQEMRFKIKTKWRVIA